MLTQASKHQQIRIQMDPGIKFLGNHGGRECPWKIDSLLKSFSPEVDLLSHRSFHLGVTFITTHAEIREMQHFHETTLALQQGNYVQGASILKA